MNVKEFNVSKKQKLSAAISANISNLSYNSISKIIRNKDVKVNGCRVNKDVDVFENDTVVVYYNDDLKMKIEVLFEDENIIVVFKPRKIETVSENDNDLTKTVSSQLNQKVFAVHRLDRNTEGLVVFAKNISAKNDLDFAFKNRTIDKFYLARVFGILSSKSDEMVAYLKKFSDKSLVEISDLPKVGFEKIQTNYNLLKTVDDTSIVEVELITGKTHQIRAHFAHIGHFVIGDEKYGDSKINKKFKKKYQCLCAYKIIFHFAENSCLKYLNDKIIELDKSKIDFCQNL